MKGRFYVTFLAIALVLFSVSKGIPVKEDSSVTNSNNYVIRYVPNKSKYILDLCNKSAEVAYSVELSEEPRLSKDGDTLIINTGGGNVSQFQFFDTTHAVLSDVFENPLKIWEDNIAYMAFKDGKTILVIQNIYDEDLLYSEFCFDYSITANPADAILNFELLNDHTARLTYLSGEEYAEVETEIFW